MLDAIGGASAPQGGAATGAATTDIDTIAATLAATPVAARPAAVAQLAAHLTPVQQGELMRTLDAQGPSAQAPSDNWFGGITSAIEAAIATVEKVAAEAAKAAASPLGVEKLLGPATAKLAAKSPSLTADMKRLEADGWVIKLGTAGGGTSANRTTKTITVDRNEVGHPRELVQSLAHEVGHARYNPHIDTSSRKAFLRTTLADEGAATISNIRAEREILKAGGPDIGIAGDPANHKVYNAAYDKMVKTGDAAKARDAIGSIYGNGEHTSTTGQTYNDYYGSYYDKYYGHK